MCSRDSLKYFVLLDDLSLPSLHFGGFLNSLTTVTLVVILVVVVMVLMVLKVVELLLDFPVAWCSVVLLLYDVTSDDTRGAAQQQRLGTGADLALREHSDS